MANKPIPFANYEPDRGVASGAGMMAKGVLSQAGRYVPLQGTAIYRAGSALNDACLGAAGFYDSVGAPAVFLGDVNRLYKLIAKVATDVSKLSGYAGDADWQWSFEQFGDYILAAMRGVTLQRFELGTSSVFADIAGAPTAEVLFRIRNHMFACAGRTANWSAYNDILDWVPSAQTQAGNNLLGQNAGIIVSGVGGEQGAIFQERGIVRVAYIGGDIPFSFDEVEGGRGACSPSAVRLWGKGAFVAAEDGFYFWNGLEAEPIGQNKVDVTFSKALNYAYRGRVTSAIDTERKSWMVAYPSGSSAFCDRVLIYNWADNRWTHDEIDIQALLEMPREGVNADDEAGIIALAGSANADEISLSVDSPAWRESRKGWAVVDTTRSLKTFTGKTRRAVLDTGEFAPNDPGQTYLSEVYPIIDAEPSNVSAEFYVKQNRFGEKPFLANSTDMDETGCCAADIEGRFLKARISVRAGSPWTEASALNWTGKVAGGR
jgi:hypothetical protein